MVIDGLATRSLHYTSPCRSSVIRSPFPESYSLGHGSLLDRSNRIKSGESEEGIVRSERVAEEALTDYGGEDVRIEQAKAKLGKIT